MCQCCFSKILTNVSWLYKTLTIGATEWRVYVNSLHCFYNFAVNFKLLKAKRHWVVTLLKTIVTIKCHSVYKLYSIHGHDYLEAISILSLLLYLHNKSLNQIMYIHHRLLFLLIYLVLSLLQEFWIIFRSLAHLLLHL